MPDHSSEAFQLLELIEPNIQTRNDNHNNPFCATAYFNISANYMIKR